MAGVTTRTGLMIPQGVRRWNAVVVFHEYGRTVWIALLVLCILRPDEQYYGVTPFTIVPPTTLRKLQRLRQRQHNVRTSILHPGRRPSSGNKASSLTFFMTATSTTNDSSPMIVRPKNFKEAHAILHQHVAESLRQPEVEQLPSNAPIKPQQQEQQFIEIQGYIVKRRALGSSLVFLDLVMTNTEENDPNNKEVVPTPIQALLKKDCHAGDFFEFYHKAIQPGTYVTLVGYGQPSRNPGETLLFISKATLNQPNSNPQHANAIFQRLQDYHHSSTSEEQPNHGLEPLDQPWSILLQEVASAFRIDPTILWNRIQTGVTTRRNGKANDIGTTLVGQNITAKQQRRRTGGYGGDSAHHMTLAKELLGQLEAQLKIPLKDPSQLMGSSASKKVELLPPSTEQIPHWILLHNHNNSVPSILPTQEKMIQPQSVRTIMEQASSAAATTTTKQNNTDASSSARQSPVTVVAWVQNRRRFLSSVTVLEVVDDFAAVSHEGSTTKDDSPSFFVDWTKRLKCILHPNVTFVNDHDTEGGDNDCDATNLAQTTQKKKPSVIDMYGTILCAGARVFMEGHVSGSGRSNFGESSSSSSSTNNDKQQSQVTMEGEAKDDLVTLWVTEVRLLRSSWRPKVVRSVLDCMYDGRMGPEEASQALELQGGYQEAIEISQYNETMLTERQWKAAEISRTLQGSNTRIGQPFTPEMQHVLDQYASLRTKYPTTFVEPPLSLTALPKQEDRKDLANRMRNNDLGIPLRTSLPGSKWQRSKRPQLEWMLHQIRNIVEVHPDYGKRPLQVVDVGGGKGHLANFLAHHFGPEVVQVQVVDISPSAVQNGLMRARRHQLANIQYNVGDATIAQFEQGVDVVVALHACGALSDVALGHAVTSGASFAICPCCFRSNPQLRVKVPTTTITTTQSFVSALSNNNNNNNRLVTVAEWLNVAGKEEEQQFENLKSLAEVQGDMDTAAQAIHSVCALRADAVMRHHPATSDYETKNKIQVELKTFPVSFSTRNFCIIGTVSSKGDTLVEIL